MAYEFKHIRLVSFSDTDMGGIVHFANFFRYMEQAEHAFYRSLGLAIHVREGVRTVGWPRVAASCEFKAPLRFDNDVEVHLLVREKTAKSITYAFVFRKIEKDGMTDVAMGAVTVVSVAIDPVSGAIKSMPMPRDFDEKIDVAPQDKLPK